MPRLNMTHFPRHAQLFLNMNRVKESFSLLPSTSHVFVDGNPPVGLGIVCLILVDIARQSIPYEKFRLSPLFAGTVVADFRAVLHLLDLIFVGR